jgi:hypothetical protein
LFFFHGLFHPGVEVIPGGDETETDCPYHGIGTHENVEEIIARGRQEDIEPRSYSFGRLC